MVIEVANTLPHSSPQCPRPRRTNTAKPQKMKAHPKAQMPTQPPVTKYPSITDTASPTELVENEEIQGLLLLTLKAGTSNYRVKSPPSTSQRVGRHLNSH